MSAQGRLGDKAKAPLDSHGCPACPHPVMGPAIGGSPNINVNGMPALRVGDGGIHAACCGTNTWQASGGSGTVFFNGKQAHRAGDATTHCGGRGQLVEGSPNVMVGGGSSTGGAASGGGSGNASGGASGGAGGGAGGDAHAATRDAMHEAATSGKGLVHRDHDHREGKATVAAKPEDDDS